MKTKIDKAVVDSAIRYIKKYYSNTMRNYNYHNLACDSFKDIDNRHELLNLLFLAVKRKLTYKQIYALLAILGYDIVGLPIPEATQ